MSSWVAQDLRRCTVRDFPMEQYLVSCGISVRKITDNAINICCPFCPNGDTNFHCGIFHHNKNFNCWKCGATGNVQYLFHTLFGLSEGETAEILEKQTIVSSKSTVDRIRSIFSSKPKVKSVDKKQFKLPKEAQPVTSELVGRNKMLLNFLRRRRFTSIDCERFKAHVCLYGDYANRMILPIYMADKLLGFQARSMVYTNRASKYLTSPKTKISDLLYGYNVFDRTQPMLVLVEGPFDVWRIPGISIGVFGSVISVAQRRLIFDLLASVEKLVFAFDPDVFNVTAKLRRLREAAGFFRPYVKEMRIARFSANQDPASLSYETVMQVVKTGELIA